MGDAQRQPGCSCRAGAASPLVTTGWEGNGSDKVPAPGRGCQPRAGWGAAVLQHRNHSPAPSPAAARGCWLSEAKRTAGRGAPCTEQAGRQHGKQSSAGGSGGTQLPMPAAPRCCKVSGSAGSPLRAAPTSLCHRRSIPSLFVFLFFPHRCFKVLSSKDMQE